jgi:hypothetical protein
MPLQSRNMAGGRAGRVGAGLLPQPNGLAVLYALGLGEDCSAPPGAPRPQPSGTPLGRSCCAPIWRRSRWPTRPWRPRWRNWSAGPGPDSSNSSRPPSQDGLRKPTQHGRGEQTGRRPGTANPIAMVTSGGDV